jgi:hypothetical protein
MGIYNPRIEAGFCYTEAGNGWVKRRALIIVDHRVFLKRQGLEKDKSDLGLMDIYRLDSGTWSTILFPY